jgi:hypothetical protein
MPSWMHFGVSLPDAAAVRAFRDPDGYIVEAFNEPAASGR